MFGFTVDQPLEETVAVKAAAKPTAFDRLRSGVRFTGFSAR